MAFRPARSISLTTDAAASAPFVYVMATFAPTAARRLAIAAPMPREPPVMSAIFPSSFFDIVLLLYAQSCRTLDRKRGQATFLFIAGCMELRSHHAAVHRQDAPGRPAGLIRREIDRGLRDLLRLPQPTQRMHPFDRGLELWILQEACDTRGHDSCRADAVASDVLFRVVHSYRLGEHDDARLGRLVGMGLKAGDGLERGGRGDIQDRAASLLQHPGNCRATHPPPPPPPHPTPPTPPLP